MANEKLPEFEYEKQAMAGEEMPEGLRFAGQHYYLGLRMLYHQFKNGVIDRETATREKKQLFSTYEYDLMWEEIADGFIRQRKNSELARAEYRKNPCHENAIKIIESIEGVKWNELRTSEPSNTLPPCKDCTERFTACHDRCPKDERGEFGYKAWKNLIEKEKKMRRFLKGFTHRRKY